MKPSKTYNVTPEKMASLRSQLAAQGVVLPPENVGQFSPPSHKEVTLAYNYDGASQLVLTLEDEAWYETAGEVWNALDPYLA